MPQRTIEKERNMPEKRQSKYVIAYVTDNDDLYTEKLNTREEVDAWLASNEDDNYKAVVIEANCGTTTTLEMKVEDHT
jgi:cell wall assembly regulator SMI1